MDNRTRQMRWRLALGRGPEEILAQDFGMTIFLEQPRSLPPLFRQQFSNLG